MSAFCNFIKEELNNNLTTVDFKMVFDFIEYLMINGDQGVRDAAATCFLENLINSSSCGRLKTSQFINLLGPASKKYCKAWDEFTGVKTEGLLD